MSYIIGHKVGSQLVKSLREQNSTRVEVAFRVVNTLRTRRTFRVHLKLSSVASLILFHCMVFLIRVDGTLLTCDVFLLCRSIMSSSWEVCSLLTYGVGSVPYVLSMVEMAFVCVIL